MVKTTSAQAEFFVFHSDSGFYLVRQMLQLLLPYESHDYQIEGVTKALEGIDLLAVLPTVQGKVAYLLCTFLL
jgi:hypothetical protein